MRRIHWVLGVMTVLAGCGGGGGGFDGANAQGIWSGRLSFGGEVGDVQMTMIEHQDFRIGGIADFMIGPPGAEPDMTITGIRGAAELLLVFSEKFSSSGAFKYDALMSDPKHMSGTLTDGGFNGEQLDLVKVQDG